MPDKTQNDKEIDILMEDYKQIYELARHHDNIASNKEAIFAVAAFGILAFSLNKDFEFWHAIGAAVISISLYLYHFHALKRMSFLRDMNFIRLREIEDRINELSGSKKSILCFQNDYEKYEEEVKSFPGNKKRFRIRRMQRTMAKILIFLWLVVIGIKITCFILKN